MATELMKDVWWVGVVDWGLRHFHGYELSTPRGSTYNSYLILDDQTALVDTAWGPFADDFIRNLASVMDPAKINYVVANHAEPDHSGSLPAVMRACPNATLVTSKRGAESVEGYYRRGWPIKAVGTGDRISLGKRELVFVEAPMIHWPDSMFTYVAGANLLLPNDAFGQHYPTAFRTNDLVDREVLYYEALRYFANILTPFADVILKKLDEVAALGVPVDMIGPSHGVIWKDDPQQIVAAYREWAQQKPSKSAVILYDSMWEATRRMAEAVGAGLAAGGVSYKLFYGPVSDRNEVNTEIFKAKGIVLGSSTVNNGYLSTLGPYLEDLEHLRFKNKVGAAFGSYGWSGEAVKLLEGKLTACKFPVVAPGVRAKWQPRPDDLDACEKLGRAVAAAVKAD